MLTLHDLSTNSYIKIGLQKLKDFGFDYFCVLPLIENEITNYGLLKSAIESQKPEFQNPTLLMELERGIDAVNTLNSLTKVEPTYQFPKYDLSGFDKTVLDQTDKKTSCIVLPTASVLNIARSTPERIQEFSIYEAKILLSNISLTGKNSFAQATSSIGISKAQLIAKAIEFYEDQILRVASTIPNLEDYKESLFLKDKDLKEEAIEDRILEIITLLFESGNTFIWHGSLSDEQKERLYNICKSARTSIDRRTKRNLIDLLRDYMTLEEINSDSIHLGQTLQRFIIK